MILQLPRFKPADYNKFSGVIRYRQFAVDLPHTILTFVVLIFSLKFSTTAATEEAENMYIYSLNNW